MKANGGSDYDVEEALCLLMQAEMSIASGATAKDLRTSDRLKSSPRKTLLIALENDWETYTKSPNINAADWLIAETLKTFGKRLQEVVRPIQPRITGVTIRSTRRVDSRKSTRQSNSVRPCQGTPCPGCVHMQWANAARSNLPKRATA